MSGQLLEMAEMAEMAEIKASTRAQDVGPRTLNEAALPNNLCRQDPPRAATCPPPRAFPQIALDCNLGTQGKEIPKLTTPRYIPVINMLTPPPHSPPLLLVLSQ
jgi:hypothetical protein